MSKGRSAESKPPTPWKLAINRAYQFGCSQPLVGLDNESKSRRDDHLVENKNV